MNHDILLDKFLATYKKEFDKSQIGWLAALKLFAVYCKEHEEAKKDNVYDRHPICLN
jgi:hypothetical protein